MAAKSALDTLLEKTAQALKDISPGFSKLPAGTQNQLCDSFLMDLVDEQGIPASGSTIVLERKSEADVQALTELLNFTKVSDKLKAFYKKKVGKPSRECDIEIE